MDFLRSFFFKNEPLISCPFQMLLTIEFLDCPSCISRRLCQLPISFIQIRFSYIQNIGETLTQCIKSISPMFRLQENLILMNKMGN